MNNSLLCYSSAITASEVPDEVSLCYEISGCKHRCRGCHSPHLWKKIGTPLKSVVRTTLRQYADYITCICFMGGEWEPEQINQIASWAKSEYPHLKLCIYSGGNEDCRKLFPEFDYIKFGSYKENLGGLDSPSTNQKMYYKNISGYTDITYKFQIRRKSEVQ